MDVHVPFHSLQGVRAFLGYNQIQYNVMIMDVQVGILITLFDCFDYNSLETIKHDTTQFFLDNFWQLDPFCSKIFS